MHVNPGTGPEILLEHGLDIGVRVVDLRLLQLVDTGSELISGMLQNSLDGAAHAVRCEDRYVPQVANIGKRGELRVDDGLVLERGADQLILRRVSDGELESVGDLAQLVLLEGLLHGALVDGHVERIGHIICIDGDTVLAGLAQEEELAVETFDGAGPDSEGIVAAAGPDERLALDGVNDEPIAGVAAMDKGLAGEAVIVEQQCAGRGGVEVDRDLLEVVVEIEVCVLACLVQRVPFLMTYLLVRQQVAGLDLQVDRGGREQADADDVAMDDVVLDDLFVLPLERQAGALAVGDAGEVVKLFGAAGIGVRRDDVVGSESGACQELVELIPRRHDHVVVVQRVLEYRIGDAVSDRDCLGVAAGQCEQALDQTAVEIAIGEDDLVLEVVIDLLPHSGDPLARQQAKLRYQIRQTGAAAGWIDDPVEVGGDSLLGQIMFAVNQGRDADGVVEHDRVDQAVGIGEEDGRDNARNRVGGRHDLRPCVCGLFDDERDYAIQIFCQIDAQPERDELFAAGLVAVNRSVVDAAALRESKLDFPLGTADVHRIAARARIDDQVSHRPQIDAVDKDTVVAGARENLDALDVEQLTQFDAGAVDALHDTAFTVRLGEHIEGVGEHGTHDSDGVEAGAAVDLDIGVLDVDQ